MPDAETHSAPLKPGKRAKLGKWLFFSILFPLLPLGYVYVKGFLVGPEVGLHELVARGGLLLLAAGLAAGGIGDLLLSGSKWLWIKVSAGGFCTLAAVSAALYYGDLSDAYTESLLRRVPLKETLNIGLAFWVSVILYSAAVFTSLVCVLVAELEAPKRREDKES